MTIRFVAALNGTLPAISGLACTGAPLDAVNDNPPDPACHPALRSVPMRRTGHEPALARALMHFARHGLAAASRAQAEAEAAHGLGNVERRTHWIGICRHLDHRMAAALEVRLADG